MIKFVKTVKGIDPRGTNRLKLKVSGAALSSGRIPQVINIWAGDKK
jgi:hypothetical protein